MYCPRCSQQQVSDDVRFCSRCGFKLGVVADLLRTDGAAVKGKGGGGAASAVPTLIALTMLFLSLLAVAASLTYLGPQSSQMRTFAIFITVISFIFLLSTSPWRLFRKLFSEDIQYAKADHPASQAAPGSIRQASWPAETALPPAQTLPIAGFSPQRVNTAEMIQPPSVTEHTTKLLGDE
ncbi:MAG TPA: zinc ribbon domain-containing protein [Pyrinomonadaceae bacterium]|jgi:ABC-type nickel/cobalt efflux system permease component RcnA|nr:zinc ribbon domain-containing protein [Pyrinomonadaceae bacterium]